MPVAFGETSLLAAGWLVAVRTVNPSRFSASASAESSSAAVRSADFLKPVAKQLAVIGENAAALAAAGNRDVELLAVDGWERAGRGDQEDVIDGLALGGVGSDGVAVGELAVIGRQNPPIGERDRVVIDRADFGELPIDEIVALVVGLESRTAAAISSGTRAPRSCWKTARTSASSSRCSGART
jgi:hypothetical protein